MEHPTLSRVRSASRRALDAIVRHPWIATAVVLLFAVTIVFASTFAAYRRALSTVDAWIAQRTFSSTPEIRAPDRTFVRDAKISRDALVAQLSASGYRESDAKSPGTFTVEDDTIAVVAAPGTSCDQQRVRVRIDGGRIAEIRQEDGRAVEAAILRGVSMAQLTGDDRIAKKWMPLSLLPDHIAKSVVAAEDRRFFDHPGVDFVSVARAAWADLRAGGVVQGGSTITQQLAKNVFLDADRTLTRKFKEALLARALEERLDKQTILEAYLNAIYFGRVGSEEIVGVERASQLYFGKSAACLTAPESLVVAGMIRAPNLYAPPRHPERAKKRAAQVLVSMDEPTTTTAAIALMALDPPTAKDTTGQGAAPYFTDYVYTSMKEVPAGTEIVSTIDLALQASAEAALVEGLEELAKKEDVEVQGAVVVLEAATGRILAMVGGSDYTASTFNRAVLARRQVGSLAKPLVALTAFEDWGLHPRSEVFDDPIVVDLDGDSWRPRNADRDYRGRMTIRAALEKSVNIPFVRLSQQVGLPRIAGHLERMGFESVRVHPSIALGAFEATPLQVAEAYATIANGGVTVKPYATESIRTPDGATIESEPQRDRIFTHSSSFMVFDMMRGVVNRGTGWRVRRAGYRYDVAGKTGTSDDGHDLWFVGLDRDRVAVVWLGADEPKALSTQAGHIAPTIWANVMKGAPRTRPAPYPLPGSVAPTPVCVDSGMLPNEHCEHVDHEYLPVGVELEPCTVHTSTVTAPWWWPDIDPPT